MGFSRKDTGVGCHFLLQRIFPTQGSNSCLLFGRQIIYHWATREGTTINTLFFSFSWLLTCYSPNYSFVLLIFKMWNKKDLSPSYGTQFPSYEATRDTGNTLFIHRVMDTQVDTCINFPFFRQNVVYWTHRSVSSFFPPRYILEIIPYWILQI